MTTKLIYENFIEKNPSEAQALFDEEMIIRIRSLVEDYTVDVASTMNAANNDWEDDSDWVDDDELDENGHLDEGIFGPSDDEKKLIDKRRADKKQNSDSFRTTSKYLGDPKTPVNFSDKVLATVARHRMKNEKISTKKMQNVLNTMADEIDQQGNSADRWRDKARHLGLRKKRFWEENGDE